MAIDITAELFEQFLQDRAAAALPLGPDHRTYNNINTEPRENTRLAHDNINNNREPRDNAQPAYNSIRPSPARAPLMDLNQRRDSRSPDKPDFHQLANVAKPQPDSQHSDNFEEWAYQDFDLFEFVGKDDFEELSPPAAADDAAKDEDQSLQKRDYMYATMQYNELADNMFAQPGAAGPNLSAGNPDLANAYMKDDRFASTASTSNACMLPQGSAAAAAGQQPSTSRMSQPNPAYRPQQPQPQQQQQQQQQQQSMPMSASQSPTQLNLYGMPIKTEPNYDAMYDNASDNESHCSSGNSSLLNTTGGSGGFGSSRRGGSMPKPRKYQIKPEAERQKPEYKVKRAKNNDAVRRSRDKAKRMQVEKEQRLEFLEKQHADHAKLVAGLQKRINDLERELLRVRNQCSCGSALTANGAANFLRR